MTKPTRALAAIALVLVSFLVVGILAEVAIRPFVSVPVAPQMFVLDPHTDYRNKPGLDERAHWRGVYDYRWTTNSQGYRGRREYAIPKPPNVRRILVIGDSFTFGLGVDDSQTYPAVLERKLSAACGPERIEVTNAGVIAFSTSQELVLLERDGLDLEPDVVVLGYFVNDPIDNIQKGVHRLEGDSLVLRPPAARPDVYGFKRIVNAIPGYTWLVRHSVLVNWMRQVYFGLRSGDLNVDTPAVMANDVADSSASPVAPPVSPAADDGSKSDVADDPTWVLMRRLVDRMRDTVEANGSKFIALLIPYRDEVDRYFAGDPAGAELIAGMRSACSDLDLECLDLAEWLVATGRAADTSSLYIPKEGHLAAGGHEITAEFLLPRLQQLLGCAPDATPALPGRAAMTDVAAKGG